jgi:Fe-S-cluster-containing dehydrogenase component
LVKN